MAGEICPKCQGMDIADGYDAQEDHYGRCRGCGYQSYYSEFSVGRMLKVVNQSSWWAGVDTGLKGGVAFLSENNVVNAYPMPIHSVRRGKDTKDEVNVHELDAIIKANLPIAKAYVETPASRPPVMEGGKVVSQGSTARSMEFGYSAGVVVGVFVANGVDTVPRLSSRTWKAKLSIVGGKIGKRQAREMVADLFPEYADLVKRVKDDGVAEAILIAYYGREFG